MSADTIRTFSLAEKHFCWDGVGIRTTAGAERDLPAHRHSFFQIFFVASGQAVHEIGGKVVQAKAGDIFFVRPYKIHRVSFPSDAQCYVIYFDENFLQRAFCTTRTMSQDPDAFFHIPEMWPFVYQGSCRYRLDAQTSRNVQGRCHRILAACERRSILDQAEIRAELTLLLTTVARVYLDEFRAWDKRHISESLRNNHVRATMSFLKENFHRPLSLPEVADKVHLTDSYLTHLLKIETGKSFKPLLDELRLENAKDLLAYTRMPLKTIAYSSGFLDATHFTKRFKAYTNTTPAQYRREKTGWT